MHYDFKALAQVGFVSLGLQLLLHIKFVDCFLLVGFSRVKNRTWKIRLSITINQIKIDNYFSLFNIIRGCRRGGVCIKCFEGQILNDTGHFLSNRLTWLIASG